MNHGKIIGFRNHQLNYLKAGMFSIANTHNAIDTTNGNESSNMLMRLMIKCLSCDSEYRTNSVNNKHANASANTATTNTTKN